MSKAQINRATVRYISPYVMLKARVVLENEQQEDELQTQHRGENLLDTKALASALGEGDKEVV